MKKLFIVIALMMPMLVSAQKFGHINTQELFTMMPEVAVVRQQMDTIQGQYETMLAGMQEEFQKKLQDYQAAEATMPEGIKSMRQQELQDMQARVQQFYQTADQDIQKKQQELLVPIQERMLKAIKTVGEKEGYTYIFDASTMVYVAPDAIDAMPSVKKELGIK